jgi:hypothetical protein
MIILLTGPTASGKTETGWVLFARKPKCVFLESDALTSVRPFDPGDERDVLGVWDQLLLNIDFHQSRGNSDFIITITPQMASVYPQVKPRIDRSGIDCHAFRLDCSEVEGLRRIAERGRGEDQEALERHWVPRDRQILSAKFPDDSVFIFIDTTQKDENLVATFIMYKIG